MGSAGPRTCLGLQLPPVWEAQRTGRPQGCFHGNLDSEGLVSGPFAYKERVHLSAKQQSLLLLKPKDCIFRIRVIAKEQSVKLIK